MLSSGPPAPHESPVPTLRRFPEVAVFSSDYPHFEGSGDPIGHYTSELAALPEQVRASFLGESIADCYARMGKPIAV